MARMNGNLYLQIARSVSLSGERTLLESDAGLRHSYSEFDVWTAKYAAWLASLGVVQGDRVLVQAGKSAHVLFLCYACIRMGAVFVPISPGCRRQEIAMFLADAGPSVVVCDPRRTDIYESLRAATNAAYKIFTMARHGRGAAQDRAAGCEPDTRIAEIDERSPAALMYTSGTTGLAKAAIITHQNIFANGNALREFWRWSAADVLLHALPLDHLHGLFVATVPSLLSGGRILFHRRFTPASALAALNEATVFMGVPTHFSRLLMCPALTRESCARIRLFISGSAPLRRQTSLSFEERTGYPILERYGMTESGGVACNPPDMRYMGSVGIPLPGFTLRIADESGNEMKTGEVGEVQFRGDSVFPGYWNRPEETAAAFTQDGYLRSGDLGCKLQDGSYEIVGRAKDIIISRGENINPLEVEAALEACPGVAEAAVVGVPHPEQGEAVVAVVIPRPAGSHEGNELNINYLRSNLKQMLAHHKVPGRILLRDTLPRTALGKVQKNLLRADPELQVADEAATR